MLDVNNLNEGKEKEEPEILFLNKKWANKKQ